MRRYFIGLLLALMLLSCKNSHDEAMKHIATLRNNLYVDASAQDNMQKAIKLDSAYNNFTLKYPKDTATVVYLYEDAQLNQNRLRHIDAADVQYKEVFTRFPHHRLAPDALFAYSFNNEQQGHADIARAGYELFLQKYPDNPLANDARSSIQMLGKNLNDVIKDFEKKDSLQDTIIP